MKLTHLACRQETWWACIKTGIACWILERRKRYTPSTHCTLTILEKFCVVLTTHLLNIPSTSLLSSSRKRFNQNLNCCLYRHARFTSSAIDLCIQLIPQLIPRAFSFRQRSSSTHPQSLLYSCGYQSSFSHSFRTK